jgi:hypothetical protein
MQSLNPRIYDLVNMKWTQECAGLTSSPVRLSLPIWRQLSENHCFHCDPSA